MIISNFLAWLFPNLALKRQIKQNVELYYADKDGGISKKRVQEYIYELLEFYKRKDCNNLKELYFLEVMFFYENHKEIMSLLRKYQDVDVKEGQFVDENTDYLYYYAAKFKEYPSEVFILGYRFLFDGQTNCGFFASKKVPESYFENVLSWRKSLIYKDDSPAPAPQSL